MEELKKNNNDTYVMLTNVYARLKNLIYEDIPKITWEKKFDIPNPLPRDQLLHLSPESFSKLKPHQDIRDNVNEWVEDTLFHVILRKKFDHSDRDKNLLYLYRLLAIKYRVTYPLKGESFTLDEDLRIVLESKICNAALAFFDTPSAQDQIISPKHKQKQSRSAVPAAVSYKADRSKSAGTKKPTPKPAPVQSKKGSQLGAVAATLGVALGKAVNPNNPIIKAGDKKPNLQAQFSPAIKAQLADDYSNIVALLASMREQASNEDVLSLADHLIDTLQPKTQPAGVPTTPSELTQDIHQLASGIANLLSQTDGDPQQTEEFNQAAVAIASLLSKNSGNAADEYTGDTAKAAELLSTYLGSQA